MNDRSKSIKTNLMNFFSENGKCGRVSHSLSFFPFISILLIYSPFYPLSRRSLSHSLLVLIPTMLAMMVLLPFSTRSHGSSPLRTSRYLSSPIYLSSVSFLLSIHPQGHFAIVVAVDIADWDDAHRFMNGAACVAMLIGPNAPIVLEKERFS